MKFNTIGIICEYNPFHFGHKYHIEETRSSTGCKNIVCIMSGSMVQRGECAIYNKWQRAAMAIDSGADLVIELPCYYVLQSADIFAYGAVKILNDMKIVDGISFGCECGSVEKLIDIADIIGDDKSDYHTCLREYLKSGVGYPRASQAAIDKVLPQYSEIFSMPNNTLGISYIKAIKSINSPLKPLCVKRNNNYHTDDSWDEFISATALRTMIHSGEDYSAYSKDYSKENVYLTKNAQSFILGYLRGQNAETLKCVKGYEEGLANLVIQSASKACSLDELYEMCVCKRYTLHRIKRYIMACILNINYSAEPSYIRVLAMNTNGSKLLKEVKEKSSLDIVVKCADYKTENKMFETDIKATDFASLCSQDVRQRSMGADYKNSPCVFK